MKPPAAAAVMADHAPAEVEGDDENTALFRKLEFFPTPPWGARAGAELVKALDPTAWKVCEPCCGQGHMAGPLSETFDVYPSDIFPYGPDVRLRDWMDDAAWGEGAAAEFDWIITNPPFSLAEDLVRKGLRRARRGVALLLPLRFMDAIGRYPILEGGETPLTVMAPFVERLPMHLGRWLPEGGTASQYAWWLWMRNAPHPGRFHLIPPGTRARLWADDDAMRYGWKAPTPLFD